MGGRLKLTIFSHGVDEVHYLNRPDALNLVAKRFGLHRWCGHLITLDQTGHVILPKNAATITLKEE